MSQQTQTENDTQVVDVLNELTNAVIYDQLDNYPYQCTLKPVKILFLDIL